jgi:hypothetical protein
VWGIAACERSKVAAYVSALLRYSFRAAKVYTPDCPSCDREPTEIIDGSKRSATCKTRDTARTPCKGRLRRCELVERRCPPKGWGQAGQANGLLTHPR